MSTMTSSPWSRTPAKRSADKELCSAVVKLYFANDGAWSEAGFTGFVTLCLKKDIPFISFMDLRDGRVFLEEEVYKDFIYTPHQPLFHTFEGQHRVIGIAFSDKYGADTFHRAIVDVNSRNEIESNYKGEFYSTRGGSNAPVHSIRAGARSKLSQLFKREKKSVDKGLEIGSPTDFKHLAHVGWTSESNFMASNLPPDLVHVFKQAGISKKDLKNRGTAEMVAAIVKEQIQESIDVGENSSDHEQASFTKARERAKATEKSTKIIHVQASSGNSQAPVWNTKVDYAAEVTKVQEPKQSDLLSASTSNPIVPSCNILSTNTGKSSSKEYSRVGEVEWSSHNHPSITPSHSMPPPPPPPPPPPLPSFNGVKSGISASSSATGSCPTKTKGDKCFHSLKTGADSCSGASGNKIQILSQESVAAKQNSKNQVLDHEQSLRKNLLQSIRAGVQLRQAKQSNDKPELNGDERLKHQKQGSENEPPNSHVHEQLAQNLARAMAHRRTILHEDTETDDSGTDSDW